jgi:hypothetical protein
MKIRPSYVTFLIASGATAIAIAAAPTALAAQSCDITTVGSECQSPGNVQLDDAPPPVSFYPYGGLGMDLGVGGGGGFHGGGGHR